jgi:hypothetical protein
MSSLLQTLKIILPSCHSLALSSFSSQLTPPPLHKLLVRLTRCVTSPHVKVCYECLHLLEHDQIISLYHRQQREALVEGQDRPGQLFQTLNKNLRENSEQHWDGTVRARSERCRGLLQRGDLA